MTEPTPHQHVWRLTDLEPDRIHGIRVSIYRCDCETVLVRGSRTAPDGPR